MEELNRFKDIQLNDMETDSIISAVSALKRKVCAEVAQEAKELADISKQLQGEVLEKRRHVMQLLSDLLLDTTIPQENPDVKKLDESEELPPTAPESAEGATDSSSLVKKTDDIMSVVFSESSNSKSSSTRREGEWRVAGRVNEDRCQRCEDLDEEEVCGNNGQTYRTLCHAVNCAGLALRDISIGACAVKVTKQRSMYM